MTNPEVSGPAIPGIIFNISLSISSDLRMYPFGLETIGGSRKPEDLRRPFITPALTFINRP
ncbi:hypothetical protein L6773_20360 [Rhodohalobacter sp. WB101]|uniref:Uncharacterized protein n=1 Tax=Rhodohalobacter sulfatireducens TaxID=2911366 RepID=A0ABS9KJA5_9BACT|nr:hypothetical protein [Rhodohalobacter sulfatireducens]